MDESTALDQAQSEINELRRQAADRTAALEAMTRERDAARIIRDQSLEVVSMARQQLAALLLFIAPQVEPLSLLGGVISQLDNAICGLKRERDEVLKWIPCSERMPPGGKLVCVHQPTADAMLAIPEPDGQPAPAADGGGKMTTHQAGPELDRLIAEKANHG